EGRGVGPGRERRHRGAARAAVRRAGRLRRVPHRRGVHLRVLPARAARRRGPAHARARRRATVRGGRRHGGGDRAAAPGGPLARRGRWRVRVRAAAVALRRAAHRGPRAGAAGRGDVPPPPRTGVPDPPGRTASWGRTHMSLVMERTSGLRPGSERLTVLSCDRGPSAPLRASLEAIAERPFVEHVLALPDLHHKENAEVPSSLAVVTRGALVPEFTSVAINDGMGVVVTDLTARDITHDLLANFFRRINAHAASHVLARNEYSLSAPDLARAAFA